MAVTPIAYATVLDYRAATGLKGADEDPRVLADLIAVSRYIDAVTGRFFGRETTDVMLPLDVHTSGSVLLIPDLSAVPTTVKVGWPYTDFTTVTAVAATDFAMYPLNAAVGPEPRPYTLLSFRYGGFGLGQRVQITGKWGWPAVPEAIRADTIQLTAIWRLESPRATGRVSELGEVVTASRDAQMLVHRLVDIYKRGDALIA